MMRGMGVVVFLPVRKLEPTVGAQHLVAGLRVGRKEEACLRHARSTQPRVAHMRPGREGRLPALERAQLIDELPKRLLDDRAD
jgi:hypothetical protein